MTLEAQTQIGSYRILRPLGAGGMGEVYEARDRRLDRNVALKLLPTELATDPERVARFAREARLLAALNHPNIVTVHAVEEVAGKHFLVMELVQGENLERTIPPDGLSLERFFELAIPLVDAVAAAHEQGVVHRDLKPANVMVDSGGRVKVLDFGLAKLHRAIPGETLQELPTATLEQVTREGRLVGTVPYMSPEQVEGRAVDHRSDLFSLGVLLYEMATGRRPFAGDTTAGLMSSILRDEPRPVSGIRPELPRHLGRIIHQCLVKHVERRLQSAKDLRNQLQELEEELASEEILARGAVEGGVKVEAPRRPGRRRWTAAAGIATLVVLGAVFLLRWEPLGAPRRVETMARSPAERKMIVVLPFENLGPPEHEYFAAGMTEEITSRLAALEHLGVISRTSALQYGGGDKGIREIGDELGVDYVLEGTVRWASAVEGPGQVRITSQLIRVVDDTHLWADSYDATLEDVFRVQSKVAGRVIEELQVAVGSKERELVERGRPTDDLEAYDAYLRGQYHMERWELPEAVASFEAAVAREPKFALAWSGASEARSFLFLSALDRSAENVDGALAAGERALELDPELPEGHLAVANYHYLVEKDYERALESLTEAHQRLPNSSKVLALFGFIQRRQGHWEESLSILQRALELDPKRSLLVNEIANSYRETRNCGEAVRLGRRAWALEPAGPFLAQLVMARFCETGDPWAALELLEEESSEMSGIARDEKYLLSIRAKLLALAGEYEEALAVLERHEHERYVYKLYSVQFPVDLARGQILEALGRAEEARPAYGRALEILEVERSKRPEDDLIHAGLGLAYAGLGEARAAVRHGQRAVELRPPSLDALEGPAFLGILAEIYARTGDVRRACETIRETLSIPGDSVHWFELHSGFASLRDEPCFRDVLAAHR